MNFCEFLFQFFLTKVSKDLLPNSLRTPAIEPFPDSIRFAIPLGEIFPRNSGLQNKQNSVDK
jgi:hypothetical protein|tara:strand:- start:1065 stop:1250 length:186 start_codon:yes stop_codon:yes gene_type:complete